jgi:hypothetical protein
MRFITLLLFFLLTLSLVKAGQPVAYKKVAVKFKTNLGKPKIKAVLRTDTSMVQVKKFDKAKLASFKQQRVFQYQEEDVQPSLWKRFWRWLWHLFDNIKFPSGRGSAIGVFLKYLFIILGIAAVVSLILLAAGVDITGLFKRKPADASVPYAESLENIHEINFDTDIAVRLLYLKALKQLSDAGLIHWQIDKTNTAYIDELTNPNQREAFTVLTRQFEFIWYGEFTINGQAFQNIKTLFANFKQTLA